MRILNISAQKPDSTGSGVYLASLVCSFAAQGHACGVIAGVAASDPCEVAGAEYVRPVRFETSELPFCVVGMSDAMPYRSTRYRDLTPDMADKFEAAFTRALDEALRRFRPDVILCHHLYLLTAIVRERASDVPVFAVSHSTDMRQLRSHGLQRDRIISAVRKLDGIFSLHDEQALEIADLYGVDPALIEVVGTGYEARVFNCEGRPGARRAEKGPRLVFVGKISVKKGVGCLIDAFAQLVKRYPEAHLTLVGGHGDSDEYERLVAQAAPLGSAVLFAGRLPQDDLVRVYRESDVFALPSFYEGLPLVVVEALACGCRVAVSDLPGIRPWLSAHAPSAPVVYVEPPRMQGVDDPVGEDLPAFTARVAESLESAAALPPCSCDLSALTWDSLAARVAQAMQR